MEKAIDYEALDICSTAFKSGAVMPAKYTCDGLNISPPLEIKNIPQAAKSLVLIMDDPDAPGGEWVHWVVWNIPVTHHLKENDIHGVEGLNDFKQHRYGGPCPPSGLHRYLFKIYALNDLLDLPAHTRKYELEKAMSGHIIGFGEISGLYKRTAAKN